MWSLDLSNPTIINARILSRMPDSLRRAVRTDWADANKPGHVADSFLEGPSFDRAGNLYLTDIPHGRILRVTQAQEWQEVAQTGGWPNGIAVHRDGSLWVTDDRLGILRLDVETGRIEAMLGNRNSESFKGVNDLIFDAQGNVYFSDQGQSGLHDPSGRVYRYRSSGQLDLIMRNVPSPNGIALSTDERFLFVSVTRANAVWRGPLLAD
jgi:gluconolactonase